MAIGNEKICEVIQKLDHINLGGFNANYQRIVVGEILKTGKEVDDLTVRELTQLFDIAKEQFNKLCA